MHILKGKAVGLDQFDAPTITFDKIANGKSVDPDNPDQPAIRSAHQTWALPSVIVANRRMFFHGRRKGEDGLPPVREVYDYFDGICQYCWKKVKWKDVSRTKTASREHIVAKANGGPDSRNNILLMHADCNAGLGTAMPKRDINGKIITEGMKPKPQHFQLPAGITARPEWLRVAPWIADDVKELELS